MAQLLPTSAHDALGRALVETLSNAADSDAAVAAVLRELSGHLDAPVVVLWLFDEDAGLLRWAADHAAEDSFAVLRATCRRLTFAPGVGLPGTVVAQAQVGWIADVTQAPSFPRAVVVADAGLRSAAAAPLSAPGGVLGVLEILRRDPGPPATGALADLRMAAGQLAAYLGQARVEARLQQSEERSASVIRAALDCIVTMSHDGRVLDFNPAAERTFGYRSEDVVGQVLAELIIPPEYREAHHEALERFHRERQGRILDRRLELPAIRADGSVFPVELTISRIGTGEPPAFVGFVRDLTERRRAEDERDRLLHEAVSARALAEAAGERAGAAYAAAEQARSAAEVAGRRLALLAEVGRRMIATRDYEETMQQVAELAIPVLADWCTVALTQSGSLRTVAVAHRDDDGLQLARELVERYPPGPDDSVGPAAVQAGGTQLIEQITDAQLARAARDDGHLDLLRRLRPRSVLTVPLVTPGRVIGAITLVMTGERQFSEDDVSLATSMAARSALAIENARLFTERSHIAETLQRSLLPAGLPDVPGLDIAARYRAAGTENLVGGDFYDFFRSGDGVWTAILGDVSGKGPEAAALTALTRHTLRAGALRETSPMSNLRLLNEALIAARLDDELRFATVLYTRISRKGDGAVVTVSTGGHMPPLVLRASGAIEPVEIRGSLLGAVEQVRLSEVDVRLDPGDLMLLYTDGVTEVRIKDPDYGERLLREVLAEHADAAADAVVAAIEAAAVAVQDGEPRDDIALIAIRASS